MNQIRNYLIVALLLCSCNLIPNEQESKPNNILEINQFTILLEELMMIEHQIQKDIPYFEYNKLTIKNSSLELFKKHKTNEKQFEKSYEYYASKPETMEKIYIDIQANMTRKLLKLQNNKGS